MNAGGGFRSRHRSPPSLATELIVLPAEVASIEIGTTLPFLALD